MKTNQTARERVAQIENAIAEAKAEKRELEVGAAAKISPAQLALARLGWGGAKAPPPLKGAEVRERVEQLGAEISGLETMWIDLMRNEVADEEVADLTEQLRALSQEMSEARERAEDAKRTHEELSAHVRDLQGKHQHLSMKATEIRRSMPARETQYDRELREHVPSHVPDYMVKLRDRVSRIGE